MVRPPKLTFFFPESFEGENSGMLPSPLLPMLTLARRRIEPRNPPPLLRGWGEGAGGKGLLPMPPASPIGCRLRFSCWAGSLTGGAGSATGEVVAATASDPSASRSRDRAATCFATALVCGGGAAGGADFDAGTNSGAKSSATGGGGGGGGGGGTSSAGTTCSLSESEEFGSPQSLGRPSSPDESSLLSGGVVLKARQIP